MKKENRFTAFIRNLKAFGKSRRADKRATSIASYMNAMIEDPNEAFEAEYESFTTEYLYA